jgi:parallel beta-helix repeat protein
MLLALEDRCLLATFTVNSTADDGNTGTLRWAVAQANAATSPSTIAFNLGSAPATITLSHGQLELSNTSEATTIDGPGAKLLSVSGNKASRVFQVDNGVTASLSGLTIMGGWTYGSGPTIVQAPGGGLYNSGTATLSGCTISGNASYQGGGLANSYEATLSLSNCTISGNSATTAGGVDGDAIPYDIRTKGPGTVTLSGCTISDNSAKTDGGMSLGRSTTTLSNCTISGNTAGGLGGDGTLIACTISGNSGAGIQNGGGGTLTDCTISGNSGGGIVGGGSLTNCTISDNSAFNGGGIEGGGSLTNCTIEGNTAQHGAGVFIFSDSITMLSGCTISDNSAQVSGGGLENSNSAVTLSNCTISGNSTQGDGGGVYNATDATLTAYACTISGDSGQVGGGFYNYKGSATLIDTIVAGSTRTGGDIVGKRAGDVTGSFNLIGTGGSGGIQGGSDGNIVLSSLTDLGLAPLGTNGGPTQTMALLPGSAAIGAGVALKAITADQRGDPLDAPYPDIGAFQSQMGSGVVNPPATFTVTSTADDGSTGTLRWAVAQANAARSASTIDFHLASTPATITLSQGQLELSNPAYSIAIDGPGSSLLSVSGNQASRVFEVAPMVTASFSDLMITGGRPSDIPSQLDDGGGLNNQGAVTLSDCTISGNLGYDGGGLYNSGTAMLSGCTLSGNSASDGGGLKSSAQGTLTLSGCTISDNSAQVTDGGGLVVYGGTTLSDCTISGNSAAFWGGGLFVYGGTATLTDCTISDNSAQVGGGFKNRSPVVLSGCTISGNTASLDAGGLQLYNTATLTDCTISGNTATENGGGLEIQGTATLTDCTISGNTAQVGSGVYNLEIQEGTAMLTDCTISGNTATMHGGGLENRGTLTLTDCTISGNSAPAGGGLYNIFFNNGQSSLLTLTDCTISGNSAQVGGGLYNIFFTNSGTVTLTDTIVAGNTDRGGSAKDIAENQAGKITGSFNLIGTGGSGDIQGGTDGNIVLTSLTSLGLAPLGDYGGPTQTMALLPGSAALGAGTAVKGVTADQRGQPLDAPPDIGAFQSQGFTLTPLAGSTPQNAATGAAFAHPLAVMVTSKDSLGPVAGGVVTFTVTPASNGAAASLSASTAVIGAKGVAQVNATADTTVGSYTVTATAAGATPVSFSLENGLGLSFSGLSDQTITYGKSHVTFAGTLANGALSPPKGETVAVTLGTVTQQAAIGAGGAFATTFDTAGLSVSGSPYTVTFAYSSDGTYASASATRSLTVTQAVPTVSISGAGGSNRLPTATVAGVDATPGAELEGVGLSLSYYSGTYTSAVQLGGLTPLAAAPTQNGSYTLLARFPGSTDYTAAAALGSFTINRVMPQITWSPPASIVYGTPLGGAQLDATTTVAGSWTYTPAAGAILGAGSGQTLAVSFTPQDTADYLTATATTTITVIRATPTLSLAAAGGSFDGKPFPASATIAGVVPGVDTTPAASLQGVPVALTYYAGAGTAGTSLGATPPTAAGTYTAVARFPGSTDYAAAESAPVSFVIGPAAVTIALASSGGAAVYGQAVTLLAIVDAAGSPGGSVTFADGTTPLGSVPLDGSGRASLTTAALAVGSHAITATYSGDADHLGARLGTVAEVIAQAGTAVVLVPLAGSPRKNAAWVVLTAAIEPLAPGGGTPSGTVRFLVKKKLLGTATLSDGAATLRVKAGRVRKRAITIVYSGDGDFRPSATTLPAATPKAMRSLAQPMVAVVNSGHPRPAPAEPETQGVALDPVAAVSGSR